MSAAGGGWGWVGVSDCHFQRSKSVINTSAVYKLLYTETNVDLNLKHQTVTQFLTLQNENMITSKILCKFKTTYFID